MHETVVLIPTYNGKALLYECLESLRRQTYRRFRAIVVNDASTDETVPYLRENFPKVGILTLPHNVGFARAVNAGLRYALRVYSPKYVAVLNNDTVVEPRWLEALVQRANTNPQIAAVTSNMLFANHPDVVNSQGGTIDWNGDGYDVNFGMKRELGKQESDQVFSACWGASLLNAAALERVGLLDEAFGAYFEDLDWGWRAHLLGYQIFYESDAVVFHEHSMSYRNNQYRKLFFCKRNALRAALKNYEAKNLPRELGHILLGYWFAIVGYLQTSSHNLSLAQRFLFITIPFRALAWNLLHLSSTLRARRVIQGRRCVTDAIILALAAQDATPVREWIKNLKRRWMPWRHESHATPHKRTLIAAPDRTSRMQRFLLAHGLTRLHARMYLEQGPANYLVGRAHALWNRLFLRPPHLWRLNLNSSTPRPWGINIFGFLDSESGVGEAARSLVRAIADARIPHALLNCPLVPHRREDRTYTEQFSPSNPYAVNVIAIYGDMLAEAMRYFGAAAFKNHYNIAYWAWELAKLPESWTKLLDKLDEVWVPSTFVARAVREAKPDIRVTVIPHAVEVRRAPYPRRHFGLPEDRFLFLTMFDFYSIFERKNPLAAIRTFQDAFPKSTEDVGLVIKCSNAGIDSENFRKLEKEIMEVKPRYIKVIPGYLARNEVASLMNVCDAYVSLHRSEGFGLTVAEAMALAKPVIATNYSGNVDFLNERNGFPVPFMLAPLARDFGPYKKGNVWAEPDEREAANAMQIVHGAQEVAAKRALAARATITSRFSPTAVGRFIEKEIRRIAADR